ncbi:MAG: folate-binding protein YgfZ [Gammaproteobacteria bacterium]|nr:folate-binding protein YgfZ [Gammaproteobacteria bacterium]
MSESWIQFLREHGAIFDDGGVRDFGDADHERRAAIDSNVLVDLSHLSLIRVSGPDAKNFLNAQLTNDVALVDAGRSQLAGWCSPKGRLLVLLRVFQIADDYLLQFPSTLRDDIIKRLRIYVLRAKVKIENADQSFVRIGVAGADAVTVVKNATGVVADDIDSSVASETFVVLRLPGIQPRLEIICSPAEAPSLWAKLKAGAVPAGRGAWAWHDVMAGIPTVVPETNEAFVPQTVNLELIGGVSFTKGCYPGQEIVARVHYRGRLKERMFRAHVAVADAPRPGDPIYAPDLPGQAAGTVVSAQPGGNGGYDLLAVIQLSSVQTGELHLRQADGPRLELRALPYSVQ